MNRKEEETTLTYDYYDDVVRFYTTRKGEANLTKKRLQPVSDEIEYTEYRNDGKVVAWDFVIPMDYIARYAAQLCFTSRKIEEDKAKA